MFSHVMIGSNDIEASRVFYDAIMRELGAKNGISNQLKGIMRYMYFHKKNIFIITEPLNGETATHGNGSTLGFQADSTDIVDSWHKTGLENGGASIEDPPGLRTQGQFSFYLAYLLDPSGNKICAMHTN